MLFKKPKVRKSRDLFRLQKYRTRWHILRPLLRKLHVQMGCGAVSGRGGIYVSLFFGQLCLGLGWDGLIFIGLPHSLGRLDGSRGQSKGLCLVEKRGGGP